MRKVFKKCVAIALAAAMAFGTNAVYTSSVANADVATGDAVNEVASATDIYLPDAIYENDFEDSTTANVSGGAIVGKGVIEDAGAEHGMVFHNAANGKRENYLTLSSDIFEKNAATIAKNKGITVSFDVNTAEAKKVQWYPAFAAYGGAPVNDENVAPMFIMQSRGVLQVNGGLGDGSATEVWNDFVNGDLVGGNAADITVDSLYDGKWHNMTATLTPTHGAFYVDGVIKNEWNISKNANGGTIDAFFTEGFLKTYKYFCLGGNQAWAWDDNDPAFMFDNVKIYADELNKAQVYYLATGSIGQEVDMINTGKATISGSNINYTFNTTDVKYDNLTLEVNDEVVATASAIDVNEETGVASYQYPITKAGDYTFKATATKNADDTGSYKDDVLKTEIGVVECANKYYEKYATLVAAPTISEDNGSYVVSWTVKEGVDYVLLVEDKDGKVVAPKSTAAGKATFTNLAEGTYTVTLTAIDGKYANQETNEFSAQKAAEASATSKFAQITTKPVFSYEFNSATENGLKLTNASIKKVTVDGKSENVLQLGNTKDLTLKHNSYATIPSLSSKDFSNGLTVTFDVNVNGAYNADNLKGWTKFFVFGNGVIGRNPVAGEFAYGFTLGLNHAVDNNDWDHKSGYYGTGVKAVDGVEEEGAAPLGTTANPMVWNWYADSSKQNRWDNITVTVAKDGTMTTYYDGVKVQSAKNAAYATEILGGMKKATNNILGGSYYSDPDLVAMMDNFAVYNTALSDADIKTLSAGKAADKTVVEEEPDPYNKTGEVTAIKFTDYEISANRKTLEVYFSAKPDKVTAVNNKGTKVKKITLGRTTKITFKKAMKIGSKVTVTATKDGKPISKTYTVKGTIKLSKVKAKKGSKKVTGKLNIKKATVKVKVKYKGKKKYTKITNYKKAKVSGKKFTLKLSKKLTKGSKVIIKVTKKNYKNKTKTVKVK